MLTSTKNKIAVAALLIVNFAMASGVVASLSLESKPTTNCTAVGNCNHGRPY